MATPVTDGTHVWTILAAQAAACSGQRATKYSPWLIGALFWPVEVMAEATLSRMRAGSSDSMSCTLWGASPQWIVTADGASTPMLRA